MKVNPLTDKPQGSFGIPPQVKEEIEQAERRRTSPEKKAPPPENIPQQQDHGWDTDEAIQKEDEEENKQTQEDRAKLLASPQNPVTEDLLRQIHRTDPAALLSAIGITPSEEDFHDLLFKGCVEKEILLCKNPMSKLPISAMIKTLTTEEMNLVDELLANDIESYKVTARGVELRRTLWVVSCCTSKLSGKVLVKQVTKEGSPMSLKDIVIKRREVLSRLNPAFIDEIVRKHAILQYAFNAILFSGDKDNLKNS